MDEVKRTDIKTGDEVEYLPEEPKCFSMLVPINGHPMHGDIKCDTSFTDWDVLQAAWTIELSVIDTLFKKGLSKERIIEHLTHMNFYRRQYLGYSLGSMSEDKDYMDAIMEIGLIQSYEEFKGKDKPEPDKAEIKITKKHK